MLLCQHPQLAYRQNLHWVLYTESIRGVCMDAHNYCVITNTYCQHLHHRASYRRGAPLQASLLRRQDSLWVYRTWLPRVFTQYSQTGNIYTELTNFSPSLSSHSHVQENRRGKGLPKLPCGQFPIIRPATLRKFTFWLVTWFYWAEVYLGQFPNNSLSGWSVVSEPTHHISPFWSLDLIINQVHEILFRDWG